jgi:hypothetical protein
MGKCPKLEIFKIWDLISKQTVPTIIIIALPIKMNLYPSKGSLLFKNPYSPDKEAFRTKHFNNINSLRPRICLESSFLAVFKTLIVFNYAFEIELQAFYPTY